MRNPLLPVFNKASCSLLLVALLCLLLPKMLSAQPTVASTPLHRFFQQHYDSTLIYHSGSGWNNSPHYLILARHQGRTYFFAYSSPYRGLTGMYYPGRLTHKVAQAEAAFRATPPDTNRYLLPLRVPAAPLDRCWQQLPRAALWNIKGDQQQPARPATECGVDDGDDNVFYLIDKARIRTAHFYAPAYWEECQGQDPSRQLALRVRVLLRATRQQAAVVE